MRILLIATLLLAGSPGASALAQGRSSTARRVGFYVTGGFATSPTRESIESAMRSAGYDDRTLGGFFQGDAGPEPRPESSSNRVVLFEAELRVTPRWGLAVGAGESRTQTEGFREDADILGDALLVKSYVRMVSATPLLAAGPFTLQVGPALYKTRSFRYDAGQDLDASSETKVGALIGAGATSRPWHGIALHAVAQYRLVGTAKMGPFNAAGGTLPQTSSSLNHMYVGGGIGVRFR
jgi:hypothetical protein